jgi:hypothetical protein
VFGSGAASAAGQPISNPAGSPMILNLIPTTVPEPTTIALAGLGGLSLMLFRRRKV